LAVEKAGGILIPGCGKNDKDPRPEGETVATPQISKEQWKAVPANRKKKDAKGVRFLKVKEGEGEKLVEVRVFANPQHITEPVPAEWLQ
jgi:hypothetical protein